MIAAREVIERERQDHLAQISARFAPGWPGIPARWTSSAKTAVGTALSSESHVRFTMSHVIFNEICRRSASPCCERMNPGSFPAHSSPVYRFPGDSVKGIRTWAATILFGPGIWWRQLAVCWLPVRMRMYAGYCPICKLPRSRMGTGCRICGSMAQPIGAAYRWTRRRCRSF